MLFYYLDAFKETINIYHQLDIVINNAAIVDEVDWEKMLSVNLVCIPEFIETECNCKN